MSSIIQSRRSIMRVQFQFPPIERFLEFQSRSTEFETRNSRNYYQRILNAKERERENSTKLYVRVRKREREKKVAREIYLPYCAARSSADSPRLLRMLGSHPYCSSCATTSVCPYCAAQCNAVSLSFVYDRKRIRFVLIKCLNLYNVYETTRRRYRQSVKRHTIHVRCVLIDKYCNDSYNKNCYVIKFIFLIINPSLFLRIL